jgi:hypothetical protein
LLDSSSHFVLLSKTGSHLIEDITIIDVVQRVGLEDTILEMIVSLTLTELELRIIHQLLLIRQGTLPPIRKSKRPKVLCVFVTYPESLCKPFYRNLSPIPRTIILHLVIEWYNRTGFLDKKGHTNHPLVNHKKLKELGLRFVRGRYGWDIPLANGQN